MERNAGTNREMLKRIVALLFALAELADRASLASRPIRRHVLAILLPAEAVVQTFTIGMARDLGTPMPPQVYLTAPICTRGGDDPADATSFALRLRVLALALAGFSARAECFACRDSGRVAAGTGFEVLRKLGQLTGCRSQGTRTPDTS